MGNQYANERARCVSQDKENMQLVFNKGWCRRKGGREFRANANAMMPRPQNSRLALSLSITDTMPAAI